MVNHKVLEQEKWWHSLMEIDLDSQCFWDSYRLMNSSDKLRFIAV